MTEKSVFFLITSHNVECIYCLQLSIDSFKFKVQWASLRYRAVVARLSMINGHRDKSCTYACDITNCRPFYSSLPFASHDIATPLVLDLGTKLVLRVHVGFRPHEFYVNHNLLPATCDPRTLRVIAFRRNIVCISTSVRFHAQRSCVFIS